jgi:hypothetical protein
MYDCDMVSGVSGVSGSLETQRCAGSTLEEGCCFGAQKEKYDWKWQT